MTFGLGIILCALIATRIIQSAWLAQRDPLATRLTTLAARQRVQRLKIEGLWEEASRLRSELATQKRMIQLHHEAIQRGMLRPKNGTEDG